MSVHPSMSLWISSDKRLLMKATRDLCKKGLSSSLKAMLGMKEHLRVHRMKNQKKKRN